MWKYEETRNFGFFPWPHFFNFVAGVLIFFIPPSGGLGVGRLDQTDFLQGKEIKKGAGGGTK